MPMNLSTPASRTLLRQTAMVLGGTLLLSLSSRVELPMVPVPMTMQTLAVTMIGALYGWRLAAVTVLAWLAQGAVGLPVFAGGVGGIAKLIGPTAGYLWGFVPAAMATGWLVRRAAPGHALLRGFLAMLAGNALCLIPGWAWLATMAGAERAFMLGVAPFLLGAAVKSGLGAALLGATRVMPRQG
ncbi:biotin transporter BioY [Rhodovarius crocodyli]|uniref:Biotin transporter n=2 Tax=Rhodovarius crocodyli TaxID=1979269 RepID=A0A437M3L2_9PROT|nr:biotin transporter BioY [Rhodovarius crocodyli]